MQESDFGGTFDQLSFAFLMIFLMKFLQKMRLYFVYTKVQKGHHVTKNSNQGGPA